MRTSKDFFSITHRHRRLLDHFLDDFERNLSGLLTGNNHRTRNLYASVLRSLTVSEDQKINPSIITNFTKLEKVRKGVSDLSATLRANVLRVAASGRRDLLKLVVDKERALEGILHNVGTADKRSQITKVEADILDKMFKASATRVNVAFEKWKTYSYNTFVNGVSVGIRPLDLQAALFTEDGHIRTGSSLESEVDFETTSGLMQQRTQYQLGRAERLGYEACWNSNPMDQRTKALCMSATLAGVIPKSEMLNEYGYPPRMICRCDLNFVDASWVDFNNGINASVEESRVRAIELLQDMPTQKTEWKRKGHGRTLPSGDVTRVHKHTVTAPAERAGKRYANVEERLRILEKGRVPDYKWKPPKGWKAPREFKKLAQLIDPDVIALGEEGIALLTDDELHRFVAGELTKNEVEDIISGR